MITINQALFLSWVGKVFGGCLKLAAKELGFSVRHVALVVKQRRSCSRRFAMRTKRASQRLTPDFVLTIDELLDH